MLRINDVDLRQIAKWGIFNSAVTTPPGLWGNLPTKGCLSHPLVPPKTCRHVLRGLGSTLIDDFINRQIGLNENPGSLHPYAADAPAMPDHCPERGTIPQIHIISTDHCRRQYRDDGRGPFHPDEHMPPARDRSATISLRCQCSW